MIQPKSYSVICPKCSYSKVVHPQSDVLDIRDIILFCPKCNNLMQKKEPSSVTKFMDFFNK